MRNFRDKRGNILASLLALLGITGPPAAFRAPSWKVWAASALAAKSSRRVLK
jgi:hypothetical protein